MNSQIFLNLSNQPVVKPKEKPIIDRTSVYGIVIENDKILLVRPKGFYRWEIPGGGVEKGEDDFSALKREMIEEANCEILAPGKLVGEDRVHFYADDLDLYYNQKRKYYLATDYKMIDKPLDSEIEEKAFFELNGSLENVLSDHIKVIQKVIK